jgi:hypothetical protein
MYHFTAAERSYSPDINIKLQRNPTLLKSILINSLIEEIQIENGDRVNADEHSH